MHRMDDLIDGTDIEVDCECGAVVKTTVGAIRRSPTLKCPNGHEFKVDGSQLNRDLRGSDRAHADLERPLDKLDGMTIG